MSGTYSKLGADGGTDDIPAKPRPRVFQRHNWTGLHDKRFCAQCGRRHRRLPWFTLCPKCDPDYPPKKNSQPPDGWSAR